MSSKVLGLTAALAEAALPFFAEAIVTANDVAPAKWGVTPYNPGLRLNVGFCEAFTILPHEIGLVVIRDLVDLRSLPSGIELQAGHARGDFYQTARGSGRLTITTHRLSRLHTILAAVWPAHVSILRTAAAYHTFNHGSRIGHRGWAIREVSQAIKRALPLPAYDASDEIEFWEGKVRRVFLNRHERNPQAREACLKHYGTACFACGVDLTSIYGNAAEGVVHVHHLHPFSETEGSRRTDPIADLCPVCPNCHAVIHAVSPSRSIEAVKRLIQDCAGR
jgi:hypothetical protein